VDYDGKSASRTERCLPFRLFAHFSVECIGQWDETGLDLAKHGGVDIHFDAP
jgi:hypothetical protein